MSHLKPRAFNQKKQSYFEITNSISWLLMDACWMFEYIWASYFFILPTIISAIVLCVKVPSPSVRLANTGLLFWVVLNVLWMIADYTSNSQLLSVAKVLFPVGLLIILFALFRSQNKKEILNSFRRFHKMFNKKDN
jgi:hypothetical protein